MDHAKDMNLRDMLDEVGLVLSRYESEIGTKQSFNYDVNIDKNCFMDIDIVFI